MAHPLDKQDLDNVNNALKSIKGVRDVIARAKLSNIDVSEQEAQINNAESRLMAIKQGFFPNNRA